MSHSYLEDNIIESLARTLFVSRWTEREEMKAEFFNGSRDFDKLAPETTPDARMMAARIVGMLEHANCVSVVVLFDRARRANMLEGLPDPDPFKFGSDLGFMATGDGVSWFDDNAEFEMVVPYVEVAWEHVEGSYCPEESCPQKTT